MTSFHKLSKQLAVALVLLIMFTTCTGYRHCYVANEDVAPGELSTLYVYYQSDLYRLTDFQEEKNFITGQILKVRPSQQTTNHFIIHADVLEIIETTKGNSEVQIPHTGIDHITAPDGQILTGLYPIKLGLLVHQFTSNNIASVSKHCPLVYDLETPDMPLIGEIYSGANQAPIERHDYLQLSGISRANNAFHLRLSNEVFEEQHTNLLEVIRIQHPKNIQVLIDKYHKTQAISRIESPVQALTLTGTNVLTLIAHDDNMCFSGDISNMSSDGLILEYAIPKNCASAKLVINAKNSFWLDHVIGQYHQLWGRKYDQWQKQQQHLKADELQQWALNAGIPISVYIWKFDHWEWYDHYRMTGPMRFKKDVLAVNLDPTMGATFRVKLEWGKYFWEIDQVGIDFTPYTATTQQSFSCSSAIDQHKRDVTNLISADDKLYLNQVNLGDATTLTFPLKPENPNQTYTYFLHSKGYYNILQQSKGRTQKDDLKRFERPGHFKLFSLQTYMSK